MGILQVHYSGGNLHLQGADFDRRISEATSSYFLFATNDFANIPENGDPFGIVAQLVIHARLSDSGVVRISVKARTVEVEFTAATTGTRRENFIPRALRTVAGRLPFQLKFL